MGTLAFHQADTIEVMVQADGGVALRLLVVAEKIERQKGWAIAASFCKISALGPCVEAFGDIKVAAARSRALSKAGLAYLSRSTAHSSDILVRVS